MALSWETKRPKRLQTSKPGSFVRHYNITAANQIRPGPRAWTSSRNHRQYNLVSDPRFQRERLATYHFLLWMADRPDFTSLQTSWRLDNHNKLSSFSALIECFHTRRLLLSLAASGRTSQIILGCGLKCVQSGKQWAAGLPTAVSQMPSQQTTNGFYSN